MVKRKNLLEFNCLPLAWIYNEMSVQKDLGLILFFPLHCGFVIHF